MPAIFENDDIMISYKIVILGVLKYARISLIDNLSSVSVFWYYHFAKSCKCAVPKPAEGRFKFRCHPNPVPNLVLNLPRMNSHVPLSLSSQSYWYPDFSWPRSCLSCIPTPLLSWFCPRISEEQTLVAFYVPDSLWLPLENDLSSE